MANLPPRKSARLAQRARRRAPKESLIPLQVRGGKRKLDLLYRDAEAARKELQTSSALSTQNYQEAYDTAARLWGDKLGENWMPISRKSHHCVPAQCAMEQLRISSVFQREAGVWKLYHLCVYVFRQGSATGPACGGAVANHQRAELEFAQMARADVQCVQISDAYVCARTGLMHICRTGICEYIDSTEQHIRRGESACTLTGNILEERILVDKFWRPHCVSTSSETCRLSWTEISRAKRFFSNSALSDKNGLPQMTWAEALADIETNLLTEMCDISDIRYYLTKRRPKRNAESPFNEYCAIALLRVASLFCKTRFMEDLKAAREARRLANRSVMRAINREDSEASAIALRNIQKVGLDARPVPTNILLSGKARKNFFMIYAMRALKMWLVIRTRTRLGRDEPWLFPFSDFVIAAMYIQCEGIKVPAAVTGGKYLDVVIREDVVLKKVLPDISNFEKMDCDRTIVMNLIKQIKTAIVDAIRDERCDPTDLDPDSITIESIPPSVYLSLKKQKDSNPPTCSSKS